MNCGHERFVGVELLTCDLALGHTGNHADHTHKIEWNGTREGGSWFPMATITALFMMFLGACSGDLNPPSIDGSPNDSDLVSETATGDHSSDTSGASDSSDTSKPKIGKPDASDDSKAEDAGYKDAGSFESPPYEAPPYEASSPDTSPTKREPWPGLASCNPIDQTGCDAGMACFFTCLPGVIKSAYCEKRTNLGEGKIGASCNESLSKVCAPGFSCAPSSGLLGPGFCHALCESDADCGKGSTCSLRFTCSSSAIIPKGAGMCSS